MTDIDEPSTSTPAPSAPAPVPKVAAKKWAGEDEDDDVRAICGRTNDRMTTGTFPIPSLKSLRQSLALPRQ